MNSKRRTKRSTEDQGRRPQEAQRAMPVPQHPHPPRYPLQQQTDGEACVGSQHSARKKSVFLWIEDLDDYNLPICQFAVLEFPSVYDLTGLFS